MTARPAIRCPRTGELPQPLQPATPAGGRARHARVRVATAGRVGGWVAPSMAAAWLLVACGGTQTGTGLPDESADLDVASRSGSAFSSAGTTPAGPETGGTAWRWVEARCTEGPLDLQARGFAQRLRIEADNQGLLLVYDQVFATEQCAQTVVQRAHPPSGRAREWTMIEEARVAAPPTERCEGRMEDERPGEVRRRGEMLEVLVQRSNVWCNGLEVQMVYAPAEGEQLGSDEIARRYVAHFNRRDAARVAALFAEGGSLVEPFQVTETGGPSRHDGRAAVQQWFEDVFAGVEWQALHLLSIEEQRGGNVVVSWEYMDPRIEQPMAGRNVLTIAVGEIFEAAIEVAAPTPDA